ncbi:MAG TPA: hypothetical protein VMU60_05990 [Syntrophobacteria bacterium]|nr:hypothetical protein [Syntrophobacteria bacterium]
MEINIIELWKAIHGGCWPGPPPDLKLSKLVNELVAGLAAYNLANSFADKKVAAALKATAVQSLNATLPALQKQIGG